jgi:hypothetical protein
VRHTGILALASAHRGTETFADTRCRNTCSGCGSLDLAGRPIDLFLCSKQPVLIGINARK